MDYLSPVGVAMQWHTCSKYDYNETMYLFLFSYKNKKKRKIYSLCTASSLPPNKMLSKFRQFWAGWTYVDFKVLQESTDALQIIVPNCDPVCMAMQDRRENKGIKLSFIANTQRSCKGRIKRLTTIGNLALHDLVAPACKNSGTQKGNQETHCIFEPQFVFLCTLRRCKNMLGFVQSSRAVKTPQQLFLWKVFDFYE